MYVVAPDPDRDEDAWEEWLSEQRGRVEDAMLRAGLTMREHDAYWLRVGYRRRWREVGQAFAVCERRRVQRPTNVARHAYRRARQKLRDLVIACGMVTSPLHPAYTGGEWHGGWNPDGDI